MNDSPKSSLSQDTPSNVTVRLYGHGNVKSFKNQKQIIPARNGRPSLLVTKPDRKKQMDAIIHDIFSLLLSASLTAGDATSTARSRRSLIASLLPEDDSRQWIPQITIDCLEVEPGDEGVDFTLERL